MILPTMETSAFEILMESVLKMSSLMDVSVFVLVENRNNQRRFGGSNHLCDMYSGGRLEGEADDVRLKVDGPATDLKSVESGKKAEGDNTENWMTDGSDRIVCTSGKRRAEVNSASAKKPRTVSQFMNERYPSADAENTEPPDDNDQNFQNQEVFAEISGYYDEEQEVGFGRQNYQESNEEEWNENVETPSTRRTSRRTRKLRSTDFSDDYFPAPVTPKQGKQKFKKKSLDQPLEQYDCNETITVEMKDVQPWAIESNGAGVLVPSTAKPAPNMPYMCASEECATKANTYYKSKDLKDHIVTHHGKDMFFDCDSCHTQSLRFKDMKKHLKESHGITQTFICFICYRGFIAGTLYHKHWDEYHDRSCRYCYITLPTLDELKDHLVIVHQKVYDQQKSKSGGAGSAKNAPYLCKLEECGLTFHQQQQLYGHIRNNHGKNIRFYCSICQEAQLGLTFTEIRSHLIADHGAKVSFLCYVDGCFRAFKDKELYLEHKKLEHAHECRYCLSCFPSDDDLQNHTKHIHSILDEGGLTCRKCGMLCVDNYKLKVHQQRCWHR